MQDFGVNLCGQFLAWIKAMVVLAIRHNDLPACDFDQNPTPEITVVPSRF